VCYFLAIGAVAEAWRLGAFFEAELDVDAGIAQAAVLAAFPAEDVVRILMRRGCSWRRLAHTGVPARARSRYDEPGNDQDLPT
jgi:hypothetical protein